MAVIQSRIDELRFLKRKNLEEESKIVGNYYRDLIRQYGVDCNYYKIKIPYSEYFRPIIDHNAKVRSAYGEDIEPDYSISSDMLTFMEVENDVFQLNKYGIIPNMDVNFYFNTKDFACSLASKLGQLKEYPITETEFSIEVPECSNDSIEYTDENGNKRYFSPFSDNLFPYGIGYGIPEYFYSDILSGRFACKIGEYEIGKEYTVMCDPYKESDAKVKFPVNDTIYKSFDHVMKSSDFVDLMLFLTYKVHKVKIGNQYKFILNGKLHGNVLFHDMNKVGKYLEMIHPDVGDIVTIDFPDENNRQQFEITDCYDKQLTNDGINPLLHRYIWKCKARRYVNSGENFPEKNEYNERMDEKIDFIDNTDEIIAKDISMYDEHDSDDAYGGYERKIESHDKRKVEKKNEKIEPFKRDDGERFEDDGTFIELLRFHDDSRLVTDSYDLFFVDTKNIGYKLSMIKEEIPSNCVKSDEIQYLKATDNALFFVNMDNGVNRLADDYKYTKGEIEICLNSITDTTYDDKDNNENGNSYYKFRECNTVLISVFDHLYVRFGNREHKMVKLV